MTNQEIFELLARFEKSSIHSMKLADGDFSLELQKAESPAPQNMAAAYAAAPAAAVQQQSVSADPEIKAPLAGVFYAAPAPGEEPFVRVGDSVRKGQTVCLMEAMKMISEIPAPCDCIITEILGENGKLAAFDEPIFRYKPC